MNQFNIKEAQKMHHHGQINNVFNGDMDRIEIAPSNSSHSDLNSTGSRSILTDAHTNFHFTRTSDSPDRSRVSTPSNMMRRWSQNVSKLGRGRKSTWDKTFCRHPPLKRGACHLKSNDEIDQLANEIGQHEYLMRNSPTGEHLRIDTIRALPHPLTTKKRIKHRLSMTVTQQSTEKTPGLIKRLKFRILTICTRAHTTIRNIMNSAELWYESLKEIEGHFGSSVGAYFKFLRWLLVLNLILLFFTFCFITLPQIIYNNISKIDVHNITERPLESGSDTKLLDFFTGEGYLKQSVLFYGIYTNTTFNIGTAQKYSLPKAYFITMMCLYIITFIIISSSMARSYRISFIETSGGVRSLCAHKIFCSWDFGISNAKAARIKRVRIYQYLKQTLYEIRGSKPKLSKIWRLWTFCSQFTAHLLVGSMLAGLGTAMWILLQNFGEGEQSFPLETLYLPVSVIIIILSFQMFFSCIAKIEDYKSQSKALHITLLRNFILEGVIVGVLIIFWLTEEHVECWEDSIGQEIYRLIVVDFFISVIASSFCHFIQVHLISKFASSIDKPDFDISRKSLGLVFNQTLLWVGLIFSPLLAAVIVLKMIVTFYVHKFTLLHLCKAPKNIWRSAQTQTLYLVMTFLSILGVLIVLGYIMTQVPVSQKCGPFRGHDFMFQILIEGVLELKSNHWVWRIITAVARPAVIGGVLLTMTVVVYYLRSKSRARQVMVKLLKDMLYMEAKDKEFLLSNIARVTHNREWIFDCDDFSKELNADRDIFAEHSSTWRYQNGKMRDDPAVRCRHI